MSDVSKTSSWLLHALDNIGLGDCRGLGFHSLRRKFASELIDVPMKDVMALGGWKDHKTIIQCYQRTDLGRMREALDSRKPLTESTHQEVGLVELAS